LPFLTLAAAGLGMGACEITQSRIVSVDAGDPVSAHIVKGEAPPVPGLAPTCASTLGSYALPKAYLHVAVGASSTEAPVVTDVRHPDQNFIFYLDHLASPLSKDEIGVLKSPAGVPSTSEPYSTNKKNEFLGAVLVNSTDQTIAIARALVRAAATFATLRTAAEKMPGPATFGADLEFDPFDPSETAQANARLKELGYCVIVDGYTTPARENPGRYCNAPLRYNGFANPVARAYAELEASPVDPQAPGVMYRPRIPYTVSIYRKDDPKGPGEWKLQITSVKELENLSPVLALQIDRTAFGGTRAAFIFEAGTLKNACLSKTSEINGFVDLPVEVVKSVVAVPGKLFSIRWDTLESQKKLMCAQQSVLQMRRKLILGNWGGEASAQDTKPYKDLGALGIPGDDASKFDKEHVARGQYAAALMQDLAVKDAEAIEDSAFFAADDAKKLCGAGVLQ